VAHARCLCLLVLPPVYIPDNSARKLLEAYLCHTRFISLATASEILMGLSSVATKYATILERPIGINNDRRKVCKRTNTSVAFTQEYSRVSNTHGTCVY
jgi:hypothetical protein